MSRALPEASELEALAAVHAALRPLGPESRRKVIEAIHSLLEVSAGAKQNQDGPARAAARGKRR